MQRQILFTVLTCIAFNCLCGCGSDSPKISTDAERKAFKGGPMPAWAAKEFAASQKKSEELRAATIAKAHSDAGAEGH